MSRSSLHLACPYVTLVTDVTQPHGTRGVVEVVDAFRALSDLIVPLELEVLLEAVDSEIGIAMEPIALPAPYHALRDTLPDGVQPSPRLPDRVVAESVISPEAIDTWLRHILASQVISDPALEVVWAHLVVTAAWARVPIALGPTLTLENHESQRFAVKTRHDAGSSWIAGPVAKSYIEPPLQLSLLQEGHRAELSLAVVWPLWSELGSPGQRLLAATVARLAQQGWEIERADEIFVAR